MTLSLQDRATGVQRQWQKLGDVPNGAFREADILYDAASAKYYLFSTGSYGNRGYQVQIGNPIAGSWTLTVAGQTATMNWDDNIAAIQGKLESITGVGVGRVVVGAGQYAPGTSFNVMFDPAVVMPLTGNGSGLTGGSFTLNAQGAVYVYVATSPEKLASATPITVATGVYPSCFIDPIDGKWHLYAEKFGNPSSGKVQHWVGNGPPITPSTFVIQSAAGFDPQVIDLCVRKPVGGLVNATVGTALSVPGTRSVIPSPLTNIAIGSLLTCVNADGTWQELIRVTDVNLGAGTFTAAFKYAHTSGFIVRSAWLSVGIKNANPGAQPLYLTYADGPHGKQTAGNTGTWLPLVTAPTWVLTITGASGSDSFTLSYDGQTTDPIPYNALGTTVRFALQGLSSLTGCAVGVSGILSTGLTVTLIAGLGVAPFTRPLTATPSFGSGSMSVVSIAGTAFDSISGVFQGGRVGLPSWAAYSIFDPNLAITPDGRFWVLFSGVPSAGGVASHGIVEVDPITGWAIAPAALLPSPYPPWSTGGLGLSDITLLLSPVAGIPDRIFGFTNDGGANTASCSWGMIPLPTPGATGRQLLIRGIDVTRFVKDFPTQVTLQASGQVPAITTVINGYIIANGMQQLTDVLTGGPKVSDPVLLLENGEVRFSGKVRTPEDDPSLISSPLHTLTCTGDMEELLTPIGYLSFGTGIINYNNELFNLGTDTGRLKYLMALFLPSWDRWSYIPESGYATYAIATGYYKTNVLRVLKDIAGWPGPDPTMPVASRDWYISADYFGAQTVKYIAYFSRAVGVVSSPFNLTSNQVPTATEIQYRNPRRVPDSSRMINGLVVAGPGGEPVATSFVSGVNVAVASNGMTKNAGANGTFDAGAFSEQFLTTDGGYIDTTMALAAPWHASTVYNVGDYVRPLVPNGKRYKCTQSPNSGDHKSGLSQPAWPTIEGNTVVDNHVTWACATFDDVAIGFSPSNPNQDWTTIRYGIKTHSGLIDVVLNGTILATSVAVYNQGAGLRVDLTRVQDFSGVHWTGSVFLDVGAGLTRVYFSHLDETQFNATHFPAHVDTAIATVGGQISSVLIRRHAYDQFQRADSVGAPGNYGAYWASDVLHDDTLDTYDKRKARADAIFDRRAYPRDTFTLETIGLTKDGRRYVFIPGNTVTVYEPKFGWLPRTMAIARNVINYGGTDNRDWPTQQLELGDRFIESGDDETGFFLQAPSPEITAPPIPTGLHRIEVMPTPDGQSYAILGWDPTTHGEEWIFLRLTLLHRSSEDGLNPGLVEAPTPPLPIFRFSAAQQTATIPGLFSDRRYLVEIGAQGYSGLSSALGNSIILPTFATPVSRSVYNGSFEIPDFTNAARADGWTGNNAANGTGQRILTPNALKLPQALQLNCPGFGDSSYWRSRPIQAVVVDSAPSSQFALFLRATVMGLTATGVLTVAVEFYDLNGTLISTVYAIHGTPPLADPKVVSITASAPPKSVIARALVAADGTLTGSSTMFVGALELGPAAVASGAFYSPYTDSAGKLVTDSHGVLSYVRISI